jgi:hypothetical protein
LFSVFLPYRKEIKNEYWEFIQRGPHKHFHFKASDDEYCCQRQSKTDTVLFGIGN